MRNGVYKYNAPLEQFAIWRGGFTEEEIEQVKFLENLQQFEKGVTGRSSTPDKKIRDSDVSWLHRNENSDWVFDRMNGIISKVNYDHFLLDITGYDAFQFTKYNPDQHYTWHWDTEFGWKNYIRKISLIMLLSDPAEYEGGEFEIVKNGNITEPESFKPGKGDIVFFASWMPHRVAPVTSGTRKSLVAWIDGPREC